MGLLGRSRLLKDEITFEKGLFAEDKVIQVTLRLLKTKKTIRTIKEGDTSALRRINSKLIENLHKLSSMENFEDSVIRAIIREISEYVTPESLNITNDIKKNAARVKELTVQLNELLIKENQEVDIPEDEIQTLFKRELEIEKELDLVIINLLRDIKDLIKNTVEKKPLISIIIPAYNEDKYIRKTLRSAKRQSYPHKEIIVVNNASTDLTSEKIKPYTYREIYLNEKGISLAKNAGARKANGDILVFLDADSIMRKDLLDKVFEAYQEGYLAGIAKAAFDKQTFMSTLYTHAQYITRTLLLKIPAAFLYIKKDVFFNLGGFDESLKLAEDVVLARKVISTHGRDSIKIIKDSGIITSARRFEQSGYVRTLGKWMRALVFPSEKIDYDDSTR